MTAKDHRQIVARQLLGGDLLLCPDGFRRVHRVQYVGTAERTDKVAVEFSQGWTEFQPEEPVFIAYKKDDL